MKRVSGLFLALSALALLALTGCGSGTGETVYGSVTLDSQPVAGAVVSIEAHDKTQKLGNEIVRTDASGKFEIKPHPKKRGLTPGKYAVYVSKYVNKKTGTPPDPEFLEMEIAAGTVKNTLPQKYNDKEAGPAITVEIKPGKNELPPFALASK